MVQLNHTNVKCRICGRAVLEDAPFCLDCGVGAPGIYTRCPACKAEDYVHHKYGYAVLRAILATCIVGPLGPIFGFVGYNRTECICLCCKQGWFPFMPEEQLSPFNTLVGEEGRKSRKFKKLPAQFRLR